MLLSDASIRARCVAPLRVLDEDKYYRALQNPQPFADVHYIDFRDKVAAEERRVQALRESCMRDTTEEERAAFVPMIAPFNAELIRTVERTEYPGVFRDGEMAYDDGQGPTRKIISMGLTSAGYDMSIADDEIKIFSNVNSGEIDPKELDPDILMVAQVRVCPKGRGRYFLLPPNSYALVRTAEYVHMPRDLLAICLGKSTYARSGIAINATPIEPGWHGNVVIEIANQTTLPARIYLEEGISQFLFLQLDRPCETSYDDRGGKYQGQTGVTLPRI